MRDYLGLGYQGMSVFFPCLLAQQDGIGAGGCLAVVVEFLGLSNCVLFASLVCYLGPSFTCFIF